MNELYGLPDIPDTTFSIAHHTDPVFRNAVDSSVRIDPATIARLTARIYKGDLDTTQDLDRDFYQAVVGVMHEAVDKGLHEASAHAPSSPDDYFHHQLTHSADVFAAFKVHRAQADIAAQLLDDDGHLRPFREFQQRVLPITSQQCGRWLRTEYDTAVIRAQRAAEWQQFLEEADVLPNLEWMPSTSANPGADHQVFWGTILPISDPFWSEHRPGDRWNCKCSLQATDAKPTPRPRGFSEIANAPQPGLDSNPGTDGAVFSPSHPYFPSSCSQCPFKAPAAGVPTPSAATVPSGSPAGFSNAVKDCMHCLALNACIDRTVESPSGYNQDAEFGGRLLISKCADEKDLDDNVKIARVLLSQFDNLEVTIRAHIDPKLGKKNPEYTLNGMTGDRKAIQTEKGIADGFKKAIDQGCSVVVIDLNSGFIRGRVNLEEIARRIDNRHMDFEKGTIKECYVVYKEKAVVIRGLCLKGEIQTIIKRLEP